MCDPITLTATTAWVAANSGLIWGTGLAITAAAAGTGMSMAASAQQSKFASGMAKYQAGLNRNRAERAVKQGEFAAADAIQRRQQLAASGQVAFAGNGLLLDASPTSAPNMWAQDQAAARAFEVASIRDSASAEAWGYESNAHADLLQGSMARNAAKNDALGSLLSFGGKAASATASGLLKYRTDTASPIASGTK